MKWIKEHDVLLRVFSLLFAVILWAYVMSSRNTDKTVDYRNIPVQLDGLAQLSQNNLVILSGSSNKVSVRVTGSFSNILDMSAEYITATASVASITEPGTYNLNYRVVVDANGITMSSKTPTQVSVVVDRMTTVSVPVEIELTGTLADGYTLAGYSASPDAIAVTGPESIIGQIERAHITYDIGSIGNTVQTRCSYTLLDAKGNEVTDSHLSADTPSTTLTVTVRQNNSVPFTVSFINHPYLTEGMVQYTIDPDSVVLTGSPSVIREYNQIPLGTIDLAEVLEDDKHEFTFPILLDNGVSAVGELAHTATVTVNVEGYIRRTLTLTPDVLPGNEYLTYPEQEIPVTVFGPAELVQALRPGDLTVTPNYRLESLSAGENILPCTVTTANRQIYVFDGTQVIAGITEEELYAALHPDEVTEPQPDEENNGGTETNP